MIHRYACIFAPEFPLQSFVRLQPELKQKALAILDGEPPNEQVCSLSYAARALGIHPGMTRVELELFPQVSVLSRLKSQEVEARDALLECAGCFSPRLEDQSSDCCFICVADITGTELLFGTPEELAEKLHKQTQALGMHASIAVSSNFHASICLARGIYINRRKRVQVVPYGEEQTALQSLPLSVLPLSPEQAETLSLWGISTLGELASLKETELITRLGQQGKTMHLLATGRAPHLLMPTEPGLLLEERMELDTPVELLDSLLFVTGVMLDQLIARAQAQLLALASLTLHLGLTDGTVHTRTVRPALPTTDRQLWLKLAHLDLQTHPPGAAIQSLVLQGLPGSSSKEQLGLFSPQVPEPMRLDITLARIRNIVGDHGVGAVELKDTHRPDSFHIEHFHVPQDMTRAREIPANMHRTSMHRSAIHRVAMRQLRPAVATTVRLKNNQPDSIYFRGSRYSVDRAYGPWTYGGDWWKPTLWSVEQWDVVAKGQDAIATLCCCLTHDLMRDHWHVEALYD